jgi:hypothetical protein
LRPPLTRKNAAANSPKADRHRRAIDPPRGAVTSAMPRIATVREIDITIRQSPANRGMSGCARTNAMLTAGLSVSSKPRLGGTSSKINQARLASANTMADSPATLEIVLMIPPRSRARSPQDQATP